MAHEVDVAVTRVKFDREVGAFREAPSLTTDRGIHLVALEFPVVRVAMVKVIPIAGANVPVIMVAIEIDYANYDMDAPSVRFLDPTKLSGTGDHNPMFPIMQITEAGQPQGLVVPQHPSEARDFICHPGIREYHSHPQHAGNPWELVREEGRHLGLLWLCDLLWSNCVNRIQGVQLQLPMVTQINLDSR